MFHLIEVALLHLHTADPIEQYMNLDAGARTFAQGVGKLPTYRL